jgi:hypothetical protein
VDLFPSLPRPANLRRPQPPPSHSNSTQQAARLRAFLAPETTAAKKFTHSSGNGRSLRPLTCPARTSASMSALGRRRPPAAAVAAGQPALGSSQAADRVTGSMEEEGAERPRAMRRVGKVGRCAESRRASVRLQSQVAAISSTRRRRCDGGSSRRNPIPPPPRRSHRHTESQRRRRHGPPSQFRRASMRHGAARVPDRPPPARGGELSAAHRASCGPCAAGGVLSSRLSGVDP